MRRTTNQKKSLLATLLALLWLGGCSTDDIPSVSSEDRIAVPLSIGEEGLSITRALGDATPSVNRILILPFKKTNESLPNDAVNFVPDLSAARQIDVNVFPYTSAILNLTAGSTYQVMVLGYTRNDYDYGNPSSITRHFDIGLSGGMPATLADMAVKLVNPTNVPEFFSCMANGYNQSILLGGTFRPELINNIQGNLTRLSSGFTLDITNVPAYVTSISLTAEQLVTAINTTDGTPRQWQIAGDAGVKLLGTLTPVSGRVTLNTFMLPTFDARKSLFYLDVTYASTTERYTVKIADNPGVVSGNRIIFTPNHWVKVVGDYSSINLGFTIANDINLDDNIWDGLQ